MIASLHKATTCDLLNIVSVAELLCDPRAKQPISTFWSHPPACTWHQNHTSVQELQTRYSPIIDILFWGVPEQVVYWTFVWLLLEPSNGADVVEGV
eukprot:COSAG02_NODE_350_length_24063_cov_47.131447_21_plen_96_part_00